MRMQATRGEEFKDDFRKALPGEIVQRLSALSPWKSAWAIAQEMLVLAALIAIARACWTPWWSFPA